MSLLTVRKQHQEPPGTRSRMCLLGGASPGSLVGGGVVTGRGQRVQPGQCRWSQLHSVEVGFHRVNSREGTPENATLPHTAPRPHCGFSCGPRYCIGSLAPVPVSPAVVVDATCVLLFI